MTTFKYTIIFLIGIGLTGLLAFSPAKKEKNASNKSANSDISEWTSSEVLTWLKTLNLNYIISNFEENKINGYDLCMLSSSVLKEDLRINNFHDRNVILKSIKEHIYNQCKKLIT